LGRGDDRGSWPVRGTEQMNSGERDLFEPAGCAQLYTMERFMMKQNQPRTPEEILNRLKKFGEDTEAIMHLFVNRRVPAAKVLEARERFRALKRELESEYRLMATVKGEAALSSVASAFYWPAIQDAWANSGISGVRWNTRPDGKWFDALYQVEFYMSYWADGLKRSEK
jgi:hypothetical protein